MRKIVVFTKSYFFPIIFALLVLVICILFFKDNDSFDKSAINVNLSEDNIVVNNTLLLTDSAGKMLSLENVKPGTTGYIEFEITSTVKEKVKYEIYLTKNGVESELSSKFVKVFLTDANDNNIMEFNWSGVPTYYDLMVSNVDSDGKVLYSGFLRNKATKKFKLRMWIADTYEMSFDNKEFSVKLNADVI